MNKLNSVLISIICTVTFVQCQAGTNTSESKSTVILNDTIKSDKSQNIKVEHLLIGKWFTPHAADINITFNKDRTFIFNDFNLKTEETEVLHGTFELNDNNLILKYDNKPQQIFKFEKGKGADDNYYITNGKNYYFVKPP
jgi:hypothetical protein